MTEIGQPHRSSGRDDTTNRVGRGVNAGVKRDRAQQLELFRLIAGPKDTRLEHTGIVAVQNVRRTHGPVHEPRDPVERRVQCEFDRLGLVGQHGDILEQLHVAAALGHHEFQVFVESLQGRFGLFADGDVAQKAAELEALLQTQL